MTNELKQGLAVTFLAGALIGMLSATVPSSSASLRGPLSVLAVIILITCLLAIKSNKLSDMQQALLVSGMSGAIGGILFVAAVSAYNFVFGDTGFNSFIVRMFVVCALCFGYGSLIKWATSKD